MTEPIEYPLCWKCCNIIEETVEQQAHKSSHAYVPYTMVGCKENSQIKSFNDAQKMCPLIERTK